MPHLPRIAPRPARLACCLAALLVGGAAQAGEFTFGGKLFADVSRLQQNDHVAGTTSSATDGDLKRLYLDADYRWNAAWSAHLTTDVNWLRDASSPTDLWVRHLYLERKFGGGALLRAGADDMPMLSLTSKWWGFRYLDGLATSMAKIDSAADWGLHFKAPLVKDVDLAVSVVTGAGYKRPDTGGRADVEAVLAWHPGKSWLLAVGGYDGRLAAEDRATGPVHHDARRIDFMLAWTDGAWRLGARRSLGSNWSNLYAVRSERVEVTSVWLSRRLAPAWSVFTRADYTRPNHLTDPTRKSRYINAGVEWQPWKPLRLALVGKHTALERQGDLQRSTNEVGLWAEWVF